MKTILKSLKFSAKLIFFSVPLLLKQAYAYNFGCNNLHVIIPDYIYEDYAVRPPKIIHGGYNMIGTDNGCEKKVAVGIDNCTDYAFEQSAYGPEVEISFRDRVSFKTEALRIQQNFCFFKAGKITVTTPKNGKFKFKYRIIEGSWASKLPGVVTIDSIKSN